MALWVVKLMGSSVFIVDDAQSSNASANDGQSYDTTTYVEP